MRLEDIFGYVNKNADRFLARDRSGKGFVCPVCGSGSGPNGTGITENPRSPGHFTCWGGGCFTNRSVADILAVKNGIDPDDAKEVARNAARELGLPLDDAEEAAGEEGGRTGRRKSEEESERGQDVGIGEFFRECHGDIEKTDYWRQRGLSREIVDEFNIGFRKGWRHPKTPGAPASDRLIIPTGGGSYLARATSAEVGGRYSKQKVGPARIFNIGALYKAEGPVFVVEGEIDAMSVIMAGGRAVGLGSLSMAGRLLDEAAASPNKPPLIIALDNDGGEGGAGNKAQMKIEEKREELEGRGLRLRFADTDRLFLGCKDANEALLKDSGLFRAAVAEEEAMAEDEREREKESGLLELKRDSALEALPLLIKKIEEGGACTPTGFKRLDSELDGGLFPGLYIIGAVSALGKTTFCLQMADQIASDAERDVLIFSLEMSREELMAKSISRLTASGPLSAGRGLSGAKTTRGILDGSRYGGYSQSERDAISQAVDEYRKFAGRVYIHEGAEETTADTIRRISERHAAASGTPPVIFIDYLQIIDPTDRQRSMTDKQATDRNVKALKTLSRDLGTSVVAISSFNRENYSSSVNMASFKESGAIEYSSDVLLALQLKDMDKLDDDGRGRRSRAKTISERAARDAKELRPVSVQLKILKNRNGSRGAVDFDFYPAFNKFEETGDDDGRWIRKI